jgi:putative SOS response-associated peptidase YedK
MCGRYTLEPTITFYQRFEIINRVDDLVPRYNIAPGQDVPVVIHTSPNRLMHMRWGLIPHWAKDANVGYKMINARAETLTERPAYRGLLRAQRCIVPASGFYEWQDTGKKGKQPYYIHPGAGEYLPFAGLYDLWTSPEGEAVYSFTIITTQPTVNLQAIHNRMPAILEPAAEEAWLDPNVTDAQDLTSLLHPYTLRPLECYPVSKAVNRARFDAPQLIQQADAGA